MGGADNLEKTKDTRISCELGEGAGLHCLQAKLSQELPLGQGDPSEWKYECTLGQDLGGTQRAFVKLNFSIWRAQDSWLPQMIDIYL